MSETHNAYFFCDHYYLIFLFKTLSIQNNSYPKFATDITILQNKTQLAPQAPQSPCMTPSQNYPLIIVQWYNRNTHTHELYTLLIYE